MKLFPFVSVDMSTNYYFCMTNSISFLWLAARRLSFFHTLPLGMAMQRNILGIKFWTIKKFHPVQVLYYLCNMASVNHIRTPLWSRVFYKTLNQFWSLFHLVYELYKATLTHRIKKINRNYLTCNEFSKIKNKAYLC